MLFVLNTVYNVCGRDRSIREIVGSHSGEDVCVVYWVVTLDLKVDTTVTEERTTSIFRADVYLQSYMQAFQCVILYI
jgi:hypothetical protein